MKKTITTITLGIFLAASLIVVGSGSSSGTTVSAAELTIQTKRKKQNVGLIRRGYRGSKKGVRAGYRGGKKGAKATYRGGRWVTVRSYRGGRWVTRRVFQGGRWVTVKTANGTKRVFRRSKKVIY